MYSLYCSDGLAWLHSLPNESVDLIATDPPYASLDRHRNEMAKVPRLSLWFPTIETHRFAFFFQEAYKKLKKDAHLYVVCDQVTMFEIKPMGEAAGFRFWKPIIWDKVYIGMGYHYRSRYEVILFFEKGKRALNDLSVPDVIQAPRIRGGYPTEKPVDLFRVLIQQSTSQFETVVDPFMGSGSTGLAALQEGRKFMGCDILEHAVDEARARISRAFGGEPDQA